MNQMVQFFLLLYGSVLKIKRALLHYQTNLIRFIELDKTGKVIRKNLMFSI